jgi:hypothetical protein
MADEDNWRLRVELEHEQKRRALDHLLQRVRSRELADETGVTVSDDVAITHDGNLLFAYAATDGALAHARKAIEVALREDGIGWSDVVSRWDERLDEWLQVDPPLIGAAKAAEEARERGEEEVESRTLIARIGKLVRSEVEQTMQDAAAKLGLECELHEHPHLLDSQVAFTVRGPRRKVQEFAQDLREEELMTMRIERQVLLRPVL